jgi:hypothetical protein
LNNLRLLSLLRFRDCGTAKCIRKMLQLWVALRAAAAPSRPSPRSGASPFGCAPKPSAWERGEMLKSKWRWIGSPFSWPAEERLAFPGRRQHLSLKARPFSPATAGPAPQPPPRLSGWERGRTLGLNWLEDRFAGPSPRSEASPNRVRSLSRPKSPALPALYRRLGPQLGSEGKGRCRATGRERNGLRDTTD